MTEPAIDSYHAHIYYDDATRTSASEIRDELARRFTVELGLFGIEKLNTVRPDLP
ncbi:MAG: hypothetical protein IIA41_15780, partial [SAR324 cluster bacterium]|nr:hypothetical protein [SAR324 cluster bacterium]